MSMTFECKHRDLEGYIASTIEVKTENVTLPEIIEDFRAFLLGCGYAPESVKEYFEGSSDEE